jgi:hypothetical protein
VKRLRIARVPSGQGGLKHELLTPFLFYPQSAIRNLVE